MILISRRNYLLTFFMSCLCLNLVSCSSSSTNSVMAEKRGIAIVGPDDEMMQIARANYDASIKANALVSNASVKATESQNTGSIDKAKAVKSPEPVSSIDTKASPAAATTHTDKTVLPSELTAETQSVNLPEPPANKSSKRYSFQEFPSLVSHSEVRDLIIKAAGSLWSEGLPVLYAQSRQVTEGDRVNLKNNCSIEALDNNIIPEYALLSEQGSLRKLPSSESWFTTPDRQSPDIMQNSAVYPNSPVIVLASSKDKQYTFVKTADSAGWIKSHLLKKCGFMKWLDSVKSTGSK